MKIINVRDTPDFIPYVAQWFQKKWNVPMEAYIASMEAACEATKGIPAWYYVVDERKNIIAGVGVIAKEFHKRPDLTPNICALYVEEKFRGKGFSRKLLECVYRHLAECGISDAYFVDSTADFVERNGWTFFSDVEEYDGKIVKMYHKEILAK